MKDVPGGMKATSGGAECFETLALPVAVKKKLGVIGMKVLGQEQLLGLASVEQLIRYTLSLPVSLVSVGMPKPEHIQANADFAKSFSSMSGRQRRKLSESIEATHKLAMHRFFCHHEDVC